MLIDIYRTGVAELTLSVAYSTGLGRESVEGSAKRGQWGGNHAAKK